MEEILIAVQCGIFAIGFVAGAFLLNSFSFWKW